MSNPTVFFDVNIGGQPAGRVIMELYADKTPKTAENFRCLCTGEKGVGKSGKQLHFKGSSFHRVITQFMAQGGDFTAGNGTGGESIYGMKFADENFSVPHTKRGDLCFIPCDWLNGKHCVFGQVTDGFQVLDALESVGASDGKTRAECLIADCG